MKDLLDGRLSPEEIADDPVLASLAERIYGSDFLEGVGISRGSTKRALAEQFTDLDGEDLLIEEIPGDDLPLPMPEDMPPVPTIEIEEEFYEGRSLLGKLNIFAGLVGLVAISVNLFYGFGNFLSTCASSAHDTCGESMKLNWFDFFRMDEYIAWSPTGEIGIPDIGLAIFCMLIIWKGIRN